jgi:predicted small secreted protein
MTKKILILLLASLVFISGCECISGFGRDMQKAGSWVERNANRTNPSN